MQPPEARATTSQRPLALSGVVFAVLFLIGWFTSGGDAPDYGAPDQAVPRAVSRRGRRTSRAT